MARFSYVAKSLKGKRTGIIHGWTKKEAVTKLEQKGFRVIELNEVRETFWTKDIAIKKGLKTSVLVVYLRQFAALLQAGITVIEATDMLAEQTENKRLKQALLSMRDTLDEGKPLSEAVKEHPDLFQPYMIHMIHAGEAGGMLDDVVRRLADYYEKQNQLKNKVLSALAYPIVVSIIAIFVVLFLMLQVVPTFVQMFAGFNAELPAITIFVLRISDYLTMNWYMILFFLFLLVLTILLFRDHKLLKGCRDWLLLRTPFIGRMLIIKEVALFTRTLSSLLISSVSIVEALKIVERMASLTVIKTILQDANLSIETGKSLAKPMKNRLLPPLLSHMIAVGERSGSLDEMLEKVADLYDSEIDQTTERMKALLEPLMIIILALIVGTIVISIVVPMFDIFNHVE
ncbi:type II secretion system F family protein [Cytobacillus sp. FSL R7-0696]|uniref:type II secretion system F family protein n=1 Tax=Cytobacillus sp. FSL R7-0696 TaxID=2921691 RepID=UPI0030F8E39C